MDSNHNWSDADKRDVAYELIITLLEQVHSRSFW